MEMRFTLLDAIHLAIQAHKGQVDLAGEPYIRHPLAVMESVRAAGYGKHFQMTAILHDCVEDTVITLEHLTEMGCPAKVVRAVDAVSRRENETYAQFIERASQDAMGRVVKRFDIEHNLGRLDNLTDEDKRERLRKRYERALTSLSS